MTEQTEPKEAQNTAEGPKPGSKAAIQAENEALQARLAAAEAQLAEAKKTEKLGAVPDGSHDRAREEGTSEIKRTLESGLETPSQAQIRELRRQQKRSDMTEAEEAEYIRLTDSNGIPPKDVRGEPGSFTVSW